MSRNRCFYVATSREDVTRIEAMVQSGLDIATRWATAEPYSDEAGDFIAVDVQASDDVDIGVFVAELRAMVEAAGYVTYDEAEFDGLTG
ncbi:hypothetical protein [Prescottella equi]